MRRKYLFLLISTSLIISILTMNVSACGGFVAIRNEKVFHSVYCDDIPGAEYHSLIWFNTAKDAEVWGYTMCEKCSIFHDDDYSNDLCDYYFETDDPLLLTAMELSIEWGVECGREREREELAGSYDRGYEDGYYAGRREGKNEGIYEAERLYDERKEEIKANREEAFATIAFVVGIGFILSWLDKSKKK